MIIKSNSLKLMDRKKEDKRINSTTKTQDNKNEEHKTIGK